MRSLILLAAGALLLALYAHGWALLGFVALLPWLLLLDRQPAWAATLRWAWGLSLVFTAAGFAWFGLAIGRYTGVGEWAGLALLLLLAPLFQPQLLAFVLVRQGLRGSRFRAIGAASAWVGVEWLYPKLLGDSLGHALYPLVWLRQAADLGGVAGLTLVLLLVNEALSAAVNRRRDGLRALAPPLLAASLPPLLLAAYGAAVLARTPAADAPQLRIGLIQANIADLEQRRREQGGHAVVRELLDTHFAMSFDAIERQGADAVLWSETVYPTPFGNPKSEAGAAFDAEILATVAAAERPFVFGTYERDGEHEYNAAAFVDGSRGLLGFYRKTRLFPFTEQVPAWLDGPWLRRWLPWVGHWQAGDGARLMPLRLKDGREIPVQALICRDDVDPGLAIAAARLGAQALLTMSNDAWFSQQPLGAELHQAAAAFRSIETRLPQFRVTTNGYSALIDAQGRVQAGAAMNERALVVGSLAVPVPPRTLMVRWGDWVGGVALAGLGLLLLARGLPQRWLWPDLTPRPLRLPARVALLPPALRWASGLLRGLSRLGLLALGLALLLDENLRGQTLAQLRAFAFLVLLPEAIAFCLLAAYRASLQIEPGRLLLRRGAQQLELPLAQIHSLLAWRWPLPAAGASLRLHDGSVCLLAGVEPARLALALAAAGGPPLVTSSYAQARAAGQPGWPAAAWAKFLLLPLLLALPAFQLHQQIAYGSAFGELYSHGWAAFGLAFAIWWAAWTLGVALFAGGLRLLIELATGLLLWRRPAQAARLRWGLERAALLLLYLGLPGWLALRALG